MNGSIASGGPWCTQPMVAVIAGTNETQKGMDQQFYRIYPNPTTGAFMLELYGKNAAEKYLVEIYDMKGERMLSNELAGERKHEFSLSGKPVGIYVIRVISNKNSGTTRIIKQD